MRFLAGLGHDVKIVVEPARRARPAEIAAQNHIISAATSLELASD